MSGARQPVCRVAPRAALLVAAVYASAPVSAEPPADETQQFEVSPFVGYRVGGNFKLSDAGQHVALDDHGSFRARAGCAC